MGMKSTSTQNACGAHNKKLQNGARRERLANESPNLFESGIDFFPDILRKLRGMTNHLLAVIDVDRCLGLAVAQRSKSIALADTVAKPGIHDFSRVVNTKCETNIQREPDTRGDERTYNKTQRDRPRV